MVSIKYICNEYDDSLPVYIHRLTVLLSIVRYKVRQERSDTPLTYICFIIYLVIYADAIDTKTGPSKAKVKVRLYQNHGILSLFINLKVK